MARDPLSHVASWLTVTAVPDPDTLPTIDADAAAMLAERERLLETIEKIEEEAADFYASLPKNERRRVLMPLPRCSGVDLDVLLELYDRHIGVDPRTEAEVSNASRDASGYHAICRKTLPFQERLLARERQISTSKAVSVGGLLAKLRVFRDDDNAPVVDTIIEWTKDLAAG